MMLPKEPHDFHEYLKKMLLKQEQLSVWQKTLMTLQNAGITIIFLGLLVWSIKQIMGVWQ